MFGMPMGMEWVIIFLIVLILFGPSKLPGLGKSIGSAISEFRTSVKDKDKEEDNAEQTPKV